MSTTRHIIATFAEATPEEVAAGRTWYAEAFELATALAHTPDHRPAVTREQAAGVIAALSPLTPWHRNKELAIRAVSDHNATGTLGNSVRAANLILSGTSPLEVLKGDKVRNFYLAIIGDPRAVTIDRHAFEVYKGKRYADADRPNVGKRVYREASSAYVAATAHLNDARADNLTASQVQAITWLTWRRLHLTGTRYERFL